MTFCLTGTNDAIEESLSAKLCTQDGCLAYQNDIKYLEFFSLKKYAYTLMPQFFFKTINIIENCGYVGV